MPCRNPRRLYIHLASTYSIGPSSVVWSELGLAPPFPPMGVLEVWWSRALSLVCEVVKKCTGQEFSGNGAIWLATKRVLHQLGFPLRPRLLASNGELQAWNLKQWLDCQHDNTFARGILHRLSFLGNLKHSGTWPPENSNLRHFW